MAPITVAIIVAIRGDELGSHVAGRLESRDACLRHRHPQLTAAASSAAKVWASA